jgi:hypothetical protein
MAVSTGLYLKRFHESTWSQGDKVVNSDFTFVIDGYEDSYLRAKQFPFPQLSTGEPIEIASVLGTNYTQAGQVQFYRQGSIAFYETVLGLTNNLLVDLIAQGGEFNAWVYHGTMENYIWKRRIVKCHTMIESPDLDWENRTQPLLLTGTLHYHYYGEEEKGGVAVLDGVAGGA